MVKLAVILAAGLGSRLKDRTKEIPKGFLPVAGEPIIERSIKNLFKAGIEKIIIGTGHAAEMYEEYAERHSQISCVKNLQYKDTGSMFTLYNLREKVTADFLLLESDLLYDKNGLKVLIDTIEKNVILASGKTNSNDEVYIDANKDGYLINMSKNPVELKNIYGELVGITKVSYHCFQKMCLYAKDEFVNRPKLDYEYVLVGVSKEEKILVRKIDDYVWCEIDDENHLRRAENIIFPKIKERETNA